ncbi:response regulator [Desulfobacterales bacterium HSG16]|nr:response regulator [Desulfobacterales bacterium HSG16]
MMKILAVDDTPDNLDLLVQILEDAYEVITAESGTECLAMVKTQMPDLILLDVMMPDMDGYETMKRLQEDEDGREIPVIFISARYRDPDRILKGIELGAFDYITKPVDDEILLAKVRTMARMKMAADKHKEQKISYEELYNESPAAYFSIGTDKRIHKANHRAAELLGCDLENLVGKSIFDFYADTPFGKDLARKIMDKVLTGEKIDNTELQMVCADGTNIWITLSAKIVRDKNGKILRTHSTVLDITKQKRAQEEKEKLAVQLHHAHKMHAIDSLAGGIAHDINNILWIIIGNAELAMSDVSQWNPVSSNLNEIKTAALRAKNVIKQILSFSRISMRQMRRLNIAPIVNESMKLLKASIPSIIDIQSDIADDLDAIQADPGQIQQMIINLCTNAAQAMEPQKGILTVSLNQIDINEKSSFMYKEKLAPGRYIQLTVSDTGQGIDPEIQNRIFDPYFTTRDVGKGSGMGLAIVHGIVTSHNGAITVESELDKGTVIKMLFPACSEKHPEKKADIDEISAAITKILFVDDENSIVKMTEQMLKRSGYEVETETSPVKALELFRSKPYEFDLVLTDMTMPQMSGVNLSKKLTEIRADIPIVICTGYSTLIDKEKARDMGIAAYVKKPIVKQEIEKVIRDVLNRKKSQVQS